jgi:DNA mismatch endonuclease (patch repair protein)
MMSGIRAKNTWPERTLRSALFVAGFRYRLHVKGLPGVPDLVLPKYRAVIFVHGCFWHRHKDCRYASTPKANGDFWIQKLENNASRDERHVTALLDLGWRVAVVWECELKRSIDDVAQTVSVWLRSSKEQLTVG